MSQSEPTHSGQHSHLTQPLESDVEVERTADGVTLKVPPLGFWRGSRILVIVGLLWTGIVGFVVLMMGIEYAKGQHDLWPALLLLGLVFLPVGMAFLLSGFNMGRRRAVLAVVGDQLMVMQTGMFGSKRGQWQRHEVAEIRIGPSGMEVNEVPVMELQIHPRSGKPFGLLAGRGNKELEWVAAVLRQELNSASDKETAGTESSSTESADA